MWLNHVTKSELHLSSYYFPCQRWLAVGKDDGQIGRELVPVDERLKQKLDKKDSEAVRKEIALETKGWFSSWKIKEKQLWVQFQSLHASIVFLSLRKHLEYILWVKHVCNKTIITCNFFLHLTNRWSVGFWLLA